MTGAVAGDAAPGEVTPRRIQLTEMAGVWLGRYDTGARGWSFGYHTALFGAAVLAGLTVVFLKVFPLPSDSRENVAAALSALAALLPVVARIGGFERKWRANRDARTRIQVLKIKSTDPDFSDAAFAAELESIVSRQAAEVSGTPTNASAAPGEGGGR